MEADLFYNFRDEQERQQISGPAQKQKRKKSADSHESIRCSTCGLTITTREQKIGVNSSHTHTFFNPAGVVYELACFRKAPGCHLAGEATSEFSWFAGHVWRYALCNSCNSHLGWFFDGRDSSFFGLILKNISQ